MPVQTQMSSFAQKLGARVAQANAEHKDKPVDTGDMRLPPGIRNGVAKLSAMYTKEYPDDKNGPGTKGQTFFRASAIVMSPEYVEGPNGKEKVAGSVTQFVVPLCDMPAKGKRKASTFSDNWYEFQNLFKLLGIAAPNETPQTDPTGQRTEAYYMAAMKTLTDPHRSPTYVAFSTRGWTPPQDKPTPMNPNPPKPEEMVFETWHGLAEFNGQHDPAAGISETPPTPFAQPPNAEPFNEFPPTPEPQTMTQQGAAPPPTTGPAPQYQPSGDPDPADVVAALVEAAMNDPEGATQEGAASSAKLEELAWAAGWSKDHTAVANNWAEVGEMCLNQPPQAAPVTQVANPATTQIQPGTPVIFQTPWTAPTAIAPGAKFKFAKRTKDGAKLKNNKQEEFPAQDVEVVTVNMTHKTCTVKGKDGKTLVDIRSKQPIDVKFEWLE